MKAKLQPLAVQKPVQLMYRLCTELGIDPKQVTNMRWEYDSTREDPVVTFRWDGFGAMDLDRYNALVEHIEEGESSAGPR